EAERKGGRLDYDALSENIEAESERTLLPGLLMSDLAWAGGDDYDTLFKKATEAIRSLKRKRLEKNLDIIQMKIGEEERNKDGELCVSLYQEKAEIKKRMLQLTGLRSSKTAVFASPHPQLSSPSVRRSIVLMTL